MRRILFAIAFSALVCAPALNAQPSGYVTTRGKEIVDPHGEPLLLRGINLGNWLVPEGYMFKFEEATSPRLINGVISELIGAEGARRFWEKFRASYVTRDDIRLIRRLGLNSVRVPFDWRLFGSDDHPATWSTAAFGALDSVVAWCRESGLWVIFDMHCAPGGQTGDNIDDSWGYPFLFDSPEDQQRTATLWGMIADRYRDDRAVIGYDLLNEPIPHFVDLDRLNPMLEPLYRRIVSAIRAVDTAHIVFLGGAQWNTNFKVFGPPFDRRAVYTFHKYWCDTTQAMVQEYVDYRDKYDVPIWLGESGENSNAWIAGFRRLLERNNIGWCFWPFKKMEAPTCVVTFKRPEGWSSVATFANGDRGGYKAIRDHRLPMEESASILNELVKLCALSNCTLNQGYIEALGCVMP